MKNGIMRCISIMCLIVPFFVIAVGAETYSKSQTISLSRCDVYTPQNLSVVNISYGHTHIEADNPSAKWARIDIDYEDNLEYIPGGNIIGFCGWGNESNPLISGLYGGSVTFSGRFWYPSAQINSQSGYQLTVQYEKDGAWDTLNTSFKKEDSPGVWSVEFTIDFKDYLRLGSCHFSFIWDRSDKSSSGFFYIKQDWDIVNTYTTFDYQETFNNQITGAIDDLASQTASQFYMQNQVIGEAASNIGGAIRDTGSQVASTILNEDYGYTKPNTSTIDQGISTAGNIADTVTGHLDQFNSVREDSVNKINDVAAEAAPALAPVWNIFTIPIVLAFFLLGVTFLIIRKVLGR